MCTNFFNIFSCNVFNGIIMFFFIKTEKKETKKPVIIELNPSKISVEVGTDVRMECQAASEFNYAVPYIRWEKHRKFLLDQNSTNTTSNKNSKEKLYSEKEIKDRFSDPKYLISNNVNALEVMEVKKIEKTFKSQLVIKSVDLDDDAEYSCVAFNYVGVSRGIIFLHVFPGWYSMCISDCNCFYCFVDDKYQVCVQE